LNDSLNTNQEQSPQNEKNSNSNINSPYIPQVNIPFQLGDEIDDEKFYLYVKECIKNIKSEWSLYSKLYLKKIIKSFRKTENIFTFRRYLKEPFKEILTDFILYILTKDNKKPEDEGEITLNNNIELPKKETTTLLGKKTERQNFEKNENENSKENKNKDKGNNENINKENKENMNENNDKNNIKENSDKSEKDTNKIAEEENKDKDKEENKDKSNDIEDEIILNREYTSIIDLFNYSAQRKCVELKDNAPITKRILYEYIPKKTMISCLSAVLFDLGGKSLAETSVSSELSLFCKDSKKKIFFIDMDESFYSYTLYNGCLIINKKFFDLMNSHREKVQFGMCLSLLSIFHEMAFLLSIKMINNLNLYTY